MATAGIVLADRRGRLDLLAGQGVDQGRLADAGRADEGDRPAVAPGGPAAPSRPNPVVALMAWTGAAPAIGSDPVDRLLDAGAARSALVRTTTGWAPEPQAMAR